MNLPKTWSLVALGDIAAHEKGAIRRGPFGGSLKKEIFVESGFKVYEQQNAIKDDFQIGNYFIDEDKFREMEGFNVKPHDLIISCAGTIGKVAIVPYEALPGVINQALMRIRPNPEIILCRYLKWLLESPKYQRDIFGKSAGSALKNLAAISEIKKCKIPLPPLEEQRRIAAILDKADGVRRKRKEAIRLTEELLRSTFLEMFGDPVTNPKGWEVKRLGEICTNFQNGIGKNSEHYGHGSKVANISDLYEWHRFIPEKYSLLDVTPKEIEKYSLMRGDMLFVRSSVKREGVAVCSVYDSDEICLFSSFMIRVRPRTDLINPEFLSLMLRTPPMRNRLILGSNTSTITNISQPGLSKIEVVVPPIKTQNLITKVTKNIEESVRCHLQALEQSENLFNSLLQRAFRGEL